jgi:hypothetical protein
MSLLNTKITRDLEPGTYTARVRSYKEYNPEDRQPYLAVEMDIDNMIVTHRWYSSRIPYIMRCLRKQFRKDYFDVTLSELLEYAMTHDFTVTVSYDTRYGIQIDYREEVA